MIEECNYYCKIYIGGSLQEKELAALLAEKFQGKVKGTHVKPDTLDLDVSSNDEFDEGRPFEIADNFLYCRMLIDVEPSPQATTETYVRDVGALLELLWGSGILAIASCDFEDDLPLKGGYNYENRR